MFHGMTQQAAQRESNLTSYTSIHSSKRHNFAVLGLVETLHLEICVMHLVDHYCLGGARSSPLPLSVYPGQLSGVQYRPRTRAFGKFQPLYQI
jgi:hypothetical protein